jgi:hypothetical protein
MTIIAKFKVRLFKAILLLIYFAFILVGYSTGIQHDHIYYLKIWELDAQEINPYSILNPYGPVNILIGKLIILDPIAPKIFMIVNFAFSLLVFISFFEKRFYKLRYNFLFLILIPFNPLFFYISVIYGLNDTIVSTLVLYSIIFKFRNKPSLSALMLSIACLTKIYVIFLVPIFMLTNHKVDKKFVYTFLLVFLPANAISFLVYGYQYIFGLIDNATRSSSLLSPIDGLKILFTDGKLFNSKNLALDVVEIFVYALQVVNPLLVFLTVLYLYRLFYFKKIDWLESSTVILLVLLTFYKVVHPQFFLVFIILLVFIIYQGGDRFRRIFLIFSPITLFLAFFQLIYSNSYLAKDLASFLYLYGGLLFFPVSIYCLNRYRKEVF